MSAHADAELVMLAFQVFALPDCHCLLLRDEAGQTAMAVSREFLAMCKRMGERAALINPADPEAAVKAALLATTPAAGGDA